MYDRPLPYSHSLTPQYITHTYTYILLSKTPCFSLKLLLGYGFHGIGVGDK